MKLRPSYSLKEIQKAFDHIEKLKMTNSAKRDRIELGFSEQDVVSAIQMLTAKNFYKSMLPVREGFTAWQDVYKAKFKKIDLYIKFQIDCRGEVIILFKEK